MKVRTREVPSAMLEALTVNKEYEVQDLCHTPQPNGHIIDDEGRSRFILLTHCAHLFYRDWEVVYEPDRS